MLSLIQKCARKLFGDYYIFRIVHCDLNTVEPIDDPHLRVFSEPYEGEPDGYAGPDAYGFAYEENGKRLGECWAWYGERYKTRNFWPLKEREAKAMALETKPEARGRGIGPRVLQFAAGELKARGFTDLYGRVWHSNRASVRAVEKAGWHYHALVAEFDFLGKRRRFVIRKRRP